MRPGPVIRGLVVIEDDHASLPFLSHLIGVRFDKGEHDALLGLVFPEIVQLVIIGDAAAQMIPPAYSPVFPEMMQSLMVGEEYVSIQIPPTDLAVFPVMMQLLMVGEEKKQEIVPSFGLQLVMVKPEKTESLVSQQSKTTTTLLPFASRMHPSGPFSDLTVMALPLNVTGEVIKHVPSLTITVSPLGAALIPSWIVT